MYVDYEITNLHVSKNCIELCEALQIVFMWACRMPMEQN